MHILGNCGAPCLRVWGQQRLLLNGSGFMEMSLSPWPLLLATGNASVTINGDIQLANYYSKSTSLLIVTEEASLHLVGVSVCNVSAPLGGALHFK